MQGLELITNLAKLDQELVERVEATRRAADYRIKSAETEAQRLLAEAEAQIRRMEETLRARIVEASAKLGEDARNHAAAETERLSHQALPNLDRVVAFLLSKVMP
jgi:vacuolar-type H+-ATPase subunit H